MARRVWRGGRLHGALLGCLVALCAVPLAAGAANAVGRSWPGQACPAGTATLHPLAVIRNTRDHDFSCLALVVDEGATPLAVRFEVHHELGAKDRRALTAPIEVKQFDRAVIASAKGAVIDGQPGHDAVVLQGMLPGPTGAATLAVRYLYNGITGEWRQCGITLRLGAERRWQLENAAHETVPEVVVRTWSLPVVGTAGIATLDGICTAPRA